MALGLTSTARTLTALSCILTLIAAIFHIVAFATPSWVESDGTSPFVRIGLHEACFDHCQDPYCPSSGLAGVYFEGCSWLYAWYFDEIRPWLMPEWFKDIRTLAIVNVPLLILAFILMCVCCCLIYADNYTSDRNVTKERILQALLFLGSAMTLTGLLMGVVILIKWYTHGFQLGWMPIPDKNSFGYSFWLDFTGTLLMIFAFLAAIMAAIFSLIVKHSHKDARYSEDMMYGRGHSLGLTNR